MITETNIRAMVRSMNKASEMVERDKDPDVFTGVTYCFGAMNTYLYMMRQDKDYTVEQIEFVRKAFQNIVSMFKIDFDIDKFELVETDLPQDTEVIKLPGDEND